MPSRPWQPRCFLHLDRISRISPSIPRSSLYLTAGFLVQHSTSLAPSRHRAAQPKASLRQKPSLPRGKKTAVKPEVKTHQRTQRSGILGGKLNLPKKTIIFPKGRAKKVPGKFRKVEICCENYINDNSNLHIPLVNSLRDA